MANAPTASRAQVLQPLAYQEFRQVLARSYRRVPLELAYHPVHGVMTELYVLRQNACERRAASNPLF